MRAARQQCGCASDSRLADLLRTRIVCTSLPRARRACTHSPARVAPPPLCARRSYNKATGGKWGLRGLKLYMAARHGRKAADKAFGECQDIVIRSLLAVAGPFFISFVCSFF